MNWEIFGIAAGVITISGFIPQIIRGYRTKQLDDLSYFLNIFLIVGMSMWVVYGIQKDSFSVIISNIAGIALNFVLLSMKYLYSKK
jgi:MtN3 and saliva related transmembrane protein